MASWPVRLASTLMRSLGLVATQTLMNNLPAQVSSFIGRDTELAEVRCLLAGARLITLTGWHRQFGGRVADPASEAVR